MKSAFVAASLVAGALLGALPATAAVTLHVGTNDGIPGGEIALTLSMIRGAVDESVASAQLDVIFDTTQLRLNGSCSNGGAACQQDAECGEGHCQLSCVKDARLTVQDFNATYPEFQNLPANQRKVRLRVLAPIQVQLPLPTFEDGVVATCTFAVPADAPLGAISLSANRLEVGDEEGDALESNVVIEAGTIVSELPTPTATATIVPTDTPTEVVTETPTVTETPVTPTSIPTDSPTPPTVIVPTNTPITVVPTATTQPTTAVPTAIPTATAPPSTSTPTEVPFTATPTRKRGDDGDGCNIAAQPSDSWRAILLLALPAGMVITLRRRSR